MAAINADGNGGPFIGSGADSRNNRIDSRSFLFQGRGTAWLDARRMTQYGVLKAYFSGGIDVSTGTATTASAFWKRGYIGFAGATVGRTQSFFDFLNGAFSYGSYHLGGGSNTYDTGILLAAYTMDFGLGISATLSVEDNGARRNALWDAGTNALPFGGLPGPNGTSVLWSTICNSAMVTPDTRGSCRRMSPVARPATMRRDKSRTWSPICGSIRAGGRRRSPVPCTRSAPAPTATTSRRSPPISVPPSSPDRRRPIGGVLPSWAGAWRASPPARATKCGPTSCMPRVPIAYTGLSQFGSFGSFSRFSGGSVGAAWALDGVFANAVGPAAAGLERIRHPADQGLVGRCRLRASLESRRCGRRCSASSPTSPIRGTSIAGRRRSSAPRRSARSEVRRAPGTRAELRGPGGRLRPGLHGLGSRHPHGLESDPEPGIGRRSHVFAA